jgi:hypothetical protein
MIVRRVKEDAVRAVCRWFWDDRGVAYILESGLLVFGKSRKESMDELAATRIDFRSCVVLDDERWQMGTNWGG